MAKKSTTLLFVGALLLGCLTTSAISAPIGDQQQQPDDSVDVNQLIEEVKTTASEVGTAAYVLYKYIEEELLPEDPPSPQPPCFIRERSQDELEPSPQNDYRKFLVEDHQSAVNYVDYIKRVEEQYNDTMNANPGCDYCTRFTDTKQKMEQLLTILDTLVEAVNLTTSESSDTSTQDQGAGDSNAQDGDLTNNEPTTAPSSSSTTTSSPTSTASEMPEYCNNLCPEQQVEIFMRMDIFASVYVPLDMAGLADQLKE